MGTTLSFNYSVHYWHFIFGLQRSLFVNHPNPAIPIIIDYHIQDKEIIIVRGLWSMETYGTMNWSIAIMKSEVKKYNEDMF